MKRLRYGWLAVIVAVAALAWAGVRFQRARQGLVSLSVRDVPLGAVLDSLARQTGRRIVAATNLTARITLEAGPLPWTEMLDRVAEQAGATWSQWHAVHTRRQELDRLVETIRQRGELAGIDWTNLAPAELNTPGEALPGMTGLPGLPPGARGQMIVRTLDGPPPGDLPPGAHTLDIDTRAGGPGSDAEVEKAVRAQLKASGMPDGNVRIVRRRAGEGSNEVAVTTGGALSVAGGTGPRPAVRVITRSADASGRMTEDIWVPERIVAERGVAERLGDNQPRVPNRIAADAVARAAGGSVTTLLVFSGGAGGPLPAGLMRAITAGHAGAASGGKPPGPEEINPANLENVARRDKAERYMRLTPEQRAERLRTLTPSGPQP